MTRSAGKLDVATEGTRDARQRPTVNDIARVAGVSLATVDRVLNERPGVRQATIARVSAAIDTLGYVRDVSAANLAKQRHYELVFVMPELETEFLASLASAIEEFAEVGVNERTHVRLLTTPPRDPHALVASLDALDPADVDGVAILAPETPHVRDAITRLRHAGIAVVTMVSDLPSTAREHFVGIDNVAAGRTAGVLLGRFAGGEPGRVLVLVSSTQARDGVERRLGFDEIMSERFANLEVLPSLEGHDDPVNVSTILGNAIDAAVSDGGPPVRGVYSPAGGSRALIDTLIDRGLGEAVVVAHELTPESRDGLTTGVIDAVIAQNPGHVVRSALRVLRARSDGVDILPSQESVRIEVVLRENLPM